MGRFSFLPRTARVSAGLLGLLLLFSAFAALADKPSSIASACDANFDSMMMSDDLETPASFVAWASVPGLDAHKTIEQFKSIAPQEGFDVGADSYYGAQGTLLLTKRSAMDPRKVGIGLKATGDLTGFPMEVSVDQALGTISLVTTHRVQEDFSFKRVYYQNLMCGMLTKAAGETYKNHFDPSSQPGPGHPRNPFAGVSFKSPKQLKQMQDDSFKQNRDAINALFQHALASGKSIVVMPTINPFFGVSQGEIATTKRSQYMADSSSTTVWQGPGGSPATVIRASFLEDARHVGLHGNVWASGTGPVLYLLYIVDPGTYSVTGDIVNGYKVKMPPVGAETKPAKAGLGHVVLLTKTFQELSVGTMHNDPTYKARNVETCTLEIVGGPCVQSYNQTVYDQTSAGGDYQAVMGNPTGGLTVSETISRDFASFNVAAGEAILVDGMFAEFPTAGIDVNTCQPSADGDNSNAYNKMQCGLTQYTMLRIPAKKDDLIKAAQPYSNAFPDMITILSAIKERPLKVQANAGAVEPGRGQKYSLQSH